MPSRTTTRPVHGRGRHRQRERRLRPVAALRLHEHDGVVAVDRLAQHRVRVGRVRRHHDGEAGRRRPVRLGRVGVVLDAADRAGARDAHDHRQGHPALGAVPHLRDVRDHLLERRIAERVELHLDHRSHAVHRHADGGADDARLGERGVPDAVLAELRLQAVGDAEDAAERADVLAVDDDAVVGRHGVAQGGVERAGHRELRRGGCRGRAVLAWSSAVIGRLRRGSGARRASRHPRARPRGGRAARGARRAGGRRRGRRARAGRGRPRSS